MIRQDAGFQGVARRDLEPGRHPNLKRLVVALLLAVLPMGARAQSAHEGGWVGHTPPHLWAEPRVYHRELDPETAALLTMAQVEAPAPPESDRVFSPNKAYWYDWSRTPPDSVVIQVFNERDYLLQLEWRGADPRYGPKLKWVNEKLLYGELWRGRMLGEIFVLDVESETFLTREVMIDGAIAFRQWKEGCKTFPDIPACARP